ncbi:DUF4412 domain-containing protein [Pedobacter jamesrossensis]|uniref:DUF4412 domain-containing protein n=1 Tax=Pedobacter jamesrossensis TaxID=1908238 RepID=A0ABV8NF31_9SPHI
MKRSISFLASLFSLIILSNTSIAADVYAEYEITGMGAKSVLSKMYGKNGNVRTDVNMDVAGRQITSTSLMLKSNPGVILIFNSMTKTYTETKTTKDASIKDFSIKVLGTEKIGKYNCSHIRMTSDGKSWDMWYTKDLPSISFPINGNSAASSEKLIAELKSKGITGMPVKIVFFKPGTSTAAITMQLTKYEPKTLDVALFSIPTGYKKSGVSFDAEKMKNMTPSQRKEMMMKMMKEQMNH